MISITTIIILIIALIVIFIVYKMGSRVGASKKQIEWETLLMPAQRKDAIARSRSVIGGHFSENLAPFLPNFPFLPTECKFLGKPIDLIVFKGMDEKDIGEVVFVEVKSGKSRLNSQEKKLKETIEAKRVRWEEYRVPEEITRKRGEEDE